MRFRIDLQQIQQGGDPRKSPLLFIHGFPDSPLMWRDYLTPAEREQPWLAGRSIYTLAFPNRHTNPDATPSWLALASGGLYQEFDAHMATLIANSPTGKVSLVAHDWGATFSWRFIRRNHPASGIDRMASLSVGSSFRYDVFEHGLGAATWMYAFLFGLPYYVPNDAVRRGVAGMIVKYAGYRSDTASELYRDCYHYWHGLFWPVKLPFFMLGAGYRRPYTGFDFPVLYMRSALDRIASTQAFEDEVRRRPDCRFVELPEANHWFPEQQSELVIAELRRFLA